MDARQIAINRFGLGGSTQDAVTGKPQDWLLAQLRAFDPAATADADRVSATEGLAGIAERSGQLRSVRKGKSAEDAQKAVDGVRKDLRAYSGGLHARQVLARTRTAVETETPFPERLVHFWANHFAVSVRKVPVRALAGPMEFEAIRPNLTGRFEDLLLAVERHPAMLIFLDQMQSIGPNSPAAQGRGRGKRTAGLNENLAREIMELHTLGVRSGYTQADVTEFARALTGLTVAIEGRKPFRGQFPDDLATGDVLFDPDLHEPGPRTILGKTYAQGGEDQAHAILSDLARSPATARHLATKLARHFVSDTPPPALVERMEKSYLASDGNLSEVYRALVEAPESWSETPSKFRSPWLWGVAALRTIDGAGIEMAGRMARAGYFVRMFNGLGQPVWRPDSPAGFDDLASTWASPDGVYRRVEQAVELAEGAPADLDPRDLAERMFDSGLSDTTRGVIAGAESAQQGLALLLVAPEMMRY